MAKFATFDHRPCIVTAAGAILGGLVARGDQSADEDRARKAARLAVVLFDSVSKELLTE